MFFFWNICGLPVSVKHVLTVVGWCNYTCMRLVHFNIQSVSFHHIWFESHAIQNRCFLKRYLRVKLFLLLFFRPKFCPSSYFLAPEAYLAWNGFLIKQVKGIFIFSLNACSDLIFVSCEEKCKRLESMTLAWKGPSVGWLRAWHIWSFFLPFFFQTCLLMYFLWETKNNELLGSFLSFQLAMHRKTGLF